MKAKAQVPPTPPNSVHYVDSQLRAMFLPLAKPAIHPNFLFQMVAHTIDKHFFATHCPDTINYDTWNRMYQEMRQSAYDTTNMITAASVYQYDLQAGRDTVVMNVMMYNYYSFKDDALTTNTYFNFDTVNNILTDKYPRPGYPYLTDTVFAACPSRATAQHNVVTYRIDPDMIFHDQYNVLNPDAYILSIDFGDGTGFHDFPSANVVNSFYTADYSNLGTGFGLIPITTDLKNIFTGLTIERSVSTMGFFFQKAPPPPADSTFTLPGLNVGVYKPCNEDGGPNKKYFIYCEGLDIGDIAPGWNTTAANVYENSIKGSGLSDLRNFGYEFLVVDWQNSRIPIEENAMNLVRLIEKVKCWIAHSDDPDEQIVIMGESMGGLVARYALAWMENNPPLSKDPCLPDKMHDCRLLITMDAPNAGANVPLAYQHFYRNPLFSANPLFGIIERTLGTMTNELLDAQSAEEMLAYYVDTRLAPLPYGPATYTSHPLRYNFLNNLAAIGNFPKYCKMVAMSNGSIAGKGQTRPWDGALRTPGDKFADYTQDLQVRILKHDYMTYDLDVAMNSLSAGSNSPICHLKAQIWLPTIQLYWFGIRVVMVPAPVINRHYEGHDLVPVDVAPGSTLAGVNDFYGTIKKTLFPSWLFPATNMGNGHYHYEKSWGGKWFGGGFDMDLYSDGMNFCFIPTLSALYYYSDNLWDDIENTPVSTVMNKTPFDVITGIPEDYTSLLYSSQGNPDWYNIHLYNYDHLNVRNDSIGFWRSHGDPFHLPFHYNCDNSNRPIRFLNHEIGDDTLLVENRTMPYKGRYSAEKYVGVNQHSLYYEYPGYSTSLTIPGIYSKADPLKIITTDGFAKFYAQQANVQYDPPYTGGYSIAPLFWTECCNTGYRPSPSGINNLRGNKDNIKIYPNPTNSGFVNIQFTDKKLHSGEIKVFDVLGRKVLDENFQTSGDIFKLKLRKNTPDDVYLFLIKDNKQQYQQKVIIQNN